MKNVAHFIFSTLSMFSFGANATVPAEKLGVASISNSVVATCSATDPNSKCKVEFFDDFPGTTPWKLQGTDDVFPMILYRLQASHCFTSEGWAEEQDLIAAAQPPTQDLAAMDHNEKSGAPRELDNVLEWIDVFSPGGVQKHLG